MPDQTVNVLNAVTGYQEAVKVKQTLAENGSDLTQLKGHVAQTIARLHPKRLHLVVEQVIEETASTKTLRLKNEKGDALPPFQAGQYINLFCSIDGVYTARPYAISSSPLQRDYYDLTIKRVQDGFVSHYLLDQVKVGDRFEATSPMGTFYHNPVHHGDDLVFLAGGSGVAPAMSMLKNILEKNQQRHFHMIYVNSFVDDVIFIDELREFASNHKQFKLSEVISRPPTGYTGLSGRLTQDVLIQLVDKIEAKTFYVCGPTPFNDACIALLKQLNVADKRIRLEANGAPKHPDTMPDWPSAIHLDDEVTVRVQGKGRFKAKVGEPLMNSLERNGYFVENACRSGECSLCRVKVLSGSVFNPPEAHLRSSDKTFGWIHSCVAFPLEDLEIMY